jgi:hypothetical protein
MGATMIFRLAVWCMYLLEGIFFTGLIGCVFVVLISWISIFKEGFSDKN